MGPAGNAQVDQPGFFTPRDDPDLEAGLLFDAGQELRLVLGVPRGGGGDGHEILHPVGPGEVVELAADQHGPVHGFRLEHLLLELSLSQAHDLPLLVQHGIDAARVDPDDQKPDRVRPHVEKCRDFAPGLDQACFHLIFNSLP